jgi:hypothetical protein
MPLSWNEIKTRAASFVKNWENTDREEADAKPFLIDFLQIFGHSQRKVATFEHRVKKLNEADGYIDLLWKGMLLVEMKSRGKDLSKAYTQAKDYCHGLKEYELPQLIMVCDFETVIVYDAAGKETKFLLKDLVKNIQVFGIIAGYIKREFKEQDPVNIEAAELMGKLHDKLKAIGYTGHALEVYLVRLLFCLFADDSNIFNKDIFNDYLELKTAEDGSDLARAIAELFQVLNTAEDKRLANLDESLKEFPYVNGKLFEEQLPFASFDSEMRKVLLDCCLLDWGKISPAIFGSLFQSVMDEKARRNLGAHYTSEKNILKLIKPLFLDELWTEFEKISGSPSGDRGKTLQLQKLHDKISSLRFLDPACGCGNFLIIAYRELRLLEIEIIKKLLKLQGYRDEVIKGAQMDAAYLIKCNVDQFYGIEYEEFPAQIARTAMWLMDHQMNMLVTETFGEYYVRLPLQKAATIVHGNAMRIDWQELFKKTPIDIEAENVTVTLNEPTAEYEVKIKTKNLSIIDERKASERKIEIPTTFNYIMGNPPFVGKHLQNAGQKADMEIVFKGVSGTGVLDYVTAWYLKTAQLIQNTRTKAAFVSTNSISQGEQVGILWNLLFNLYKIKIHFAHRTFNWTNEARGRAAVHVVIIGFANFDISEKRLFEYDDIKGEPNELTIKNINPYLVEGKDEFVVRRSSPICNVPKMIWGNKPVDGGNLIIEENEKNEFIKKEPQSDKFIKQLMGATEFLYNQKRWCLWLINAAPEDIRSMPLILDRVKKVKEMRKSSVDAGARKLALTPTLFRDTNNPDKYIVIPEVSSENRKYIPIGFLNSNIIPTNLLQLIPNGELYHFGVLESEMHMTWVKNVCGRLKSDYRYSNSIVYNNYPWPENPTDKQKDAVEKAAQAVLDARAMFPDSSLADLYDPNTMPPALVKAHQQLDKAVDLCYRPQPFINETKRIEFLFELYDKYTAGLFVKEKKARKKKN